MLFPDHLHCPSVGDVAATLAGTDDIAVWTLPDWEPPRVARRMVAQWPSLTDCPEAPLVLVVTALPGESPSTLALPLAGRRIVEMAIVEPTLTGRLLQTRRRSQAVHAATERFAGWCEAGLLEAEQWISTKPADAIVTLGRLPPR